MTMQAQLEEALERFERLLAFRPPWWWWDLTMVVTGATALAAALILEPSADGHWVLFQGHQVGDTCAAITLTGDPCPQCGMTRAFVYGARLDVVRAFLYNPGGYTLFVWFEVGMVIGAIRLIARDPGAVKVPWQLPVYWTGFWFLFLYALPYVGRLFGINPLP